MATKVALGEWLALYAPETFGDTEQAKYVKRTLRDDLVATVGDAIDRERDAMASWLSDNFDDFAGRKDELLWRHKHGDLHAIVREKIRAMNGG